MTPGQNPHASRALAGTGLVRRFLKRLRSLRRRTQTPDELSLFVKRFLRGVDDDEEKALRIANWTTVEIRNEAPKGTGALATFRERKGLCGARARLFVAIAERAGLEAKVFGIYSSGLRHTAAQFKLDGKWRFVDPMYGGVFRNAEGLMEFEEVIQDPDASSLAISALSVIDEPEDGWISPTARMDKLRSLYSAANLGRVNAYGFLYEDKPVVYRLNVDLAREALPIELGAAGGGAREFMRAASQRLGAPLPNTLGATSRRISHEWNFRGAVTGEKYALVLEFQKLPKEPLQVEVSSAGAEIVSGGKLSLSNQAASKSWTVVFEARQPSCSVGLSPVFKKWAHSAEIRKISIELAANVAPQAFSAPDGCDTARRAELLGPSTSESLLGYLNGNCGITTAVRGGSFGEYGKRPRNWSWVFHGTAAIFAYRATSDTTYLRWIAEMFEEMIRHRDCETGRVDHYRNRRYRSWGAQVKDRRAGGTVWVNEVCTGGCMALPAALFAAEIERDPSLQAEFGETARRFTDVCVAVVEEFAEDVRDVPGKAQAYFVMPHDGEPEPLAHAAPFAATLVALYRATGRSEYLDLATRLRNYFKAAIVTERSGAWAWPYRPTPKDMTGPGEFFFKARVTLLFPIQAYALGLLFDETDISQFANTFLTAVARHNGGFHTTVSTKNGKPLDDDAMARFRDKGRLGSLAQIAGFYPLAYANPEVGRRIETFICENQEIFPRGWFSTPSAVEAYALRIGLEAAMRSRA